MAVGDIIIGLTTAVNTYTNYQPSSGVELIVSSVTGSNTISLGQYDGTNFTGSTALYQPYFYDNPSGGNELYGKIINMKLGITNTYYFRFSSNSGRAYFSAIQTK